MDLLEIGFGHVFERGSFKYLELHEGLGLLVEKRELFEVMSLSAQVTLILSTVVQIWTCRLTTTYYPTVS